MSRLRTSAALASGLSIFVAGFEGTRQTAYQDSVGVWTVCSGHTQGVRPGDHYSTAACRTMLVSDLEQYASGVEKCTKVQLPDARYIAMVSFAYNLGVGRYCKSIAPLLNNGQIIIACNRLLKYDTAAGITFPGLTRRREKEHNYCMYDTGLVS